MYKLNFLLKFIENIIKTSQKLLKLKMWNFIYLDFSKLRSLCKAASTRYLDIDTPSIRAFSSITAFSSFLIYTLILLYLVEFIIIILILDTL